MAKSIEQLHKMIDVLYEISDTEQNPFIRGIAVDGLTKANIALHSANKTIIDFTGQDISMAADSLITPESLTEMAAIASEFDKTGDPLLMKQAQVLDEILLTIGAQKTAITVAKKIQDEEIARLKAKIAKEESDKDPYTVVKKFHDKDNHVAEAQEAIKKIKEYRPLESPLSTRTCPDHPGAQMTRVAEGTYQCSLDRGIYNYNNGYTTMKGNKIPGGDVSNQTQVLHDRPNEFTSFETRESKLNPNI